MLPTRCYEVQVLLEEVDATEGGSTRLHHSVQRLLVKAALMPMCTMPTEQREHPLRGVFEMMLSVGDMPAASSAIAHNRVRFASHLGLALVSLGAVPGNPGVLHTGSGCLCMRHLATRCCK